MRLAGRPRLKKNYFQRIYEMIILLYYFFFLFLLLFCLIYYPIFSSFSLFLTDTYAGIVVVVIIHPAWLLACPPAGPLKPIEHLKLPLPFSGEGPLAPAAPDSDDITTNHEVVASMMKL